MTKFTQYLVEHRGFGWVLAAVFLTWCGLTAAFWATDRKAPFEILYVFPSTVRAGDVVELRGTVRRDLARNCSVSFTRSMTTPSGARFDLEGAQFYTAEQIRELDAVRPGELVLAVEVPRWVGPGTAHLVTNLQYVCNPLQHQWPISVRTDMPFEVIE